LALTSQEARVRALCFPPGYHERMRIALGFRAHSGWAAMVAATGTVNAPRILERRRVLIADPDVAGSKQPYHTAAELPFAKAERAVQNAILSSRALAAECISAAIAALQRDGHEVTACGGLLGSGRTLPGLQAILATHALIHAAEGEMFRDALLTAARNSELHTVGIREKEIDGDALTRLALVGKQIGPPWTQDQKYAARARAHRA
jgi:hypothetical protein